MQHFFTVPMCAVALQLYHFVPILLLMNSPTEKSLDGASRLRLFRRVSQESEHHSRQICSIALGARNHVAEREQMIQPL